MTLARSWPRPRAENTGSRMPAASRFGSRRARDFPGAEAGVRSMRFVAAALKSSKAGSRWVKV